MFKDGDQIFLTCNGKTVPGRIDLISPDQVSAMLCFDGALGKHVGYMGVTRHDKALGIYLSIIDGTQVRMRLRPAAKTEERETNAETTGDAG
jgi:hypothetical protein